MAMSAKGLRWLYKTGQKCRNCDAPITRRNQSGSCVPCKATDPLLMKNKQLAHNKASVRYNYRGSHKCLSCNKPITRFSKGKCRICTNTKTIVGYDQLHRRVTKRFPKPPLCQKCNIQPPRDLANKGIYNEDLKNWEWLCRRCHIYSDGRVYTNLRPFYVPRIARRSNIRATFMQGEGNDSSFKEGKNEPA